METDISVEAVAGKLNRVGYEAFLRGLRHAKGQGNRNIELAHWLMQILQRDRSDFVVTARTLQGRRRRAACRRHCGRQRIPQEPIGDAGHLDGGVGDARSRLALRDAAVWRDADPHRTPASSRCSRPTRSSARSPPSPNSSPRSTPTTSSPTTETFGASRRKATCARWTGRGSPQRARKAPPPRRAPRERRRSTVSARI